MEVSSPLLVPWWLNQNRKAARARLSLHTPASSAVPSTLRPPTPEGRDWKACIHSATSPSPELISVHSFLVLPRPCTRILLTPGCPSCVLFMPNLSCRGHMFLGSPSLTHRGWSVDFSCPLPHAHLSPPPHSHPHLPL